MSAPLKPSSGGEPASIVGVEVEVAGVDAGPDARTGLTARVQRDGQTYEVALADLAFATDSQLGLIVAPRTAAGTDARRSAAWADRW